MFADIDLKLDPNSDKINKTMEKVGSMFKEISNNDHRILTQLGVLTEIVSTLSKEVHYLRQEVGKHHDQLLLYKKGVAIVIALCGFAAVFIEGHSKGFIHF